jgi:transglutaminase-like putative cysteine protease
MATRLGTVQRAAVSEYFLLAVVAWVILPHTPQLPLWCSAFVALVLLWRVGVASGAAPPPGRSALVLLLVVSVAATALNFQTLLGTEASVALVVVLLSLKTLEMRARRDIFVVFFLGFFTVLTQFLNSQSLFSVATMLLGTLGLLSTLVLAHMPGSEPSLRAALRTAWKMAAWGLPIMALLFVLFPRIEPLWAIPDEKPQARTGLSDTMPVGSVAELAQDSRIAMRINFDGEAPAAENMYFRAHVLSQFDGKQWWSDDALNPSKAARGDVQIEGELVSYEVSLEPHGKTFLPVLDITPKEPSGEGLMVRAGADLRWVSSQPVHERLRYQATSTTHFRYGLQESAANLRAQTRLPAGFNPRILAWAATIRTSPQMTDADAQGLSAYLLSHLARGNYRYTLQPGIYGRHSADEFWFDRKTGFCEHFASAYVIAMRAMGVPARIVTGYQGAERNGVDGLWTVRQSDAHAWAEFWQEGRGWVRVDPTASSAPYRLNESERLGDAPTGLGGMIGKLSPGLWLHLRDSWEAINHRWSAWVTNYGTSQQLELLRNIGFTSPSQEQLAYVLAALLGVAAMIGALWARWQQSPEQVWQRFHSRLLQRLASKGLQVAAHQSPRALAHAAAAAYGDAAKPLSAWLMRVELARYQAGTSLVTLADLEREFHKLPWADLVTVKPG